MANNPAMGEPLKRITRMRYGEGPMGFLADQIMKEMQRVGYDPREYNLYRSPEEQIVMKARGVSKAGPYESAHQYYGASDIIDRRHAWFEGKPDGFGDPFWTALWDCVALVEEKFDVKFRPMIPWDKAHVELEGWRFFKADIGTTKPNQAMLDAWFAEMLPHVWRQHKTSARS